MKTAYEWRQKGVNVQPDGYPEGLRDEDKRWLERKVCEATDKYPFAPMYFIEMVTYSDHSDPTRPKDFPRLVMWDYIYCALEMALAKTNHHACYSRRDKWTENHNGPH